MQIIRAGAVGAVVGFVLALLLGFDPLASLDRPAIAGNLVLSAVAGFGVGVLLMVCGPTLRDLVQGAGFREASISLPVVGTLQIGLAGMQATAAWNLHIEMTTRIVTQSLYHVDQDGALHPTGRIDAALKSLYALFGIVRDELRKAGPTPPQLLKAGQPSFEVLALRLLNDELRPCLARWHPLRDEWERTGAPEADWPLLALCYRDLEAVRLRCLDFAIGFGEIAGANAPSLDKLKRDYAAGVVRWHGLGEPGDATAPPALASHARIAEAVKALPRDA